MPEVTMRRGGVVIPAEELTSADQDTITGDGTVYRPLAATGGGGGLSSVTHDSTMTGDGTDGDPLGVDGAALAGAVPVQTDNATITGNGTSSSPLAAIGAMAPVVLWTLAKSWTTTYAELQAIVGPKICLVEADPTGIRNMTARAGDPTDLNQVVFIGTSSASRQSGEGTTIVVEVGTKFADMAVTGGFRCSVQSQWISWDFSALTSPAYTTAAGKRVVWTQLGGQLIGSNSGSFVFSGTVAVSLTNVYMASGDFVTTDLDTCTIEAQARTSFFGWTSTAGNSIAIFTDSTCEWSPPQFIAAGFVLTGNVEVFNFASGPSGTSLYSLAVDGGGNVVATLVT